MEEHMLNIALILLITGLFLLASMDSQRAVAVPIEVDKRDMGR
jgi:hypothetical protein